MVSVLVYFVYLGTLATQLALSDHYVWALSPVGELLCRYGVSTDIYYFVYLGTLATQLALSDHYVWALSPAGELLCRYGVSTDI